MKNFVFISAIIPIVYLLWSTKSKKTPKRLMTIFFLGLTNLLFYFSLPTSPEPWQTVSTIRYTFPTFALMILALFMLTQTYKKEELLGYFVITNMISTLSMTYYPKLVMYIYHLRYLLFMY